MLMFAIQMEWLMLPFPWRYDSYFLNNTYTCIIATFKIIVRKPVLLVICNIVRKSCMKFMEKEVINDYQLDAETTVPLLASPYSSLKSISSQNQIIGFMTGTIPLTLHFTLLLKILKN
ncbi:uncharacterized protein LOC130811091 isoform X1 [Amaranthus tricolor]|uniref:uncharacterized protein LOC130811091 isoform X1 n=1 Tax=Amaranthus tricolor TaxID=29722 RepID=UPI00258BF425|nr:uncharacterized protein LOC130811091 isoform X1 [Amaranthus tricolor]XP_057533248.1 uncharacterized protein LOC130811091 isoform X1 [Amaranthus tricolor]